MQNFANSGGYVGLSCMANNEKHRGIGILELGPVDLRVTRRAQIACGYVADNANHRRSLIVAAVIRYEFADWVFTGKILSGKFFIDDDDWGRIRVILLRKDSALQQGYFQCLEILWENLIDARRRADRRFGARWNVHVGGVAAAAKRQRDARGSGFHSRQSCDAVNQVAEKRRVRSAGRVTSLRELDARRPHAVRGKTGRDFEEFREAAAKRSGGEEKCDGDGDLSSHENSSPTRLPRSSTARARSESPLEGHARRQRGRKKTGEKCGNDAECE